MKSNSRNSSLKDPNSPTLSLIQSAATSINVGTTTAVPSYHKLTSSGRETTSSSYVLIAKTGTSDDYNHEFTGYDNSKLNTNYIQTSVTSSPNLYNETTINPLQQRDSYSNKSIMMNSTIVNRGGNGSSNISEKFGGINIINNTPEKVSGLQINITPAVDEENLKLSHGLHHGDFGMEVSDDGSISTLPFTSEDRVDNINEFFEELFNSIDYSLLLIFLGLFVVVANVDSTGLPKLIWDKIVGSVPFSTIGSVVGISCFVLITSQLLGNVAVVQLAKPNIEHLGDQEKAYAWYV